MVSVSRHQRWVVTGVWSVSGEPVYFEVDAVNGGTAWSMVQARGDVVVQDVYLKPYVIEQAPPDALSGAMPYARPAVATAPAPRRASRPWWPLWIAVAGLAIGLVPVFFPTWNREWTQHQGFMYFNARGVQESNSVYSAKSVPRRDAYGRSLLFTPPPAPETTYMLRQKFANGRSTQWVFEVLDYRSSPDLSRMVIESLAIMVPSFTTAVILFATSRLPRASH